MWAVFSPEWQWSQKKPGRAGIPPFPELDMDSLPRYALSGGLAARLWVKLSPGVVADSKERRGRALPGYASKFATLWLKSHYGMSCAPRASVGRTGGCTKIPAKAVIGPRRSCIGA